MSTVLALLNTGIAEAPSTVVACVAMPIACIGERLTAVTEQALLQSRRALDVFSGRQNVRRVQMHMLGAWSSLRSIANESSAAKAIPVETAFSCMIAFKT